MSDLVDMLHAQRAVPCDACEDDAPGEYYCVECKQTLCPQCEKFHRKFTKCHNVVLRTQIGDIDTTTLTCIDHDDAATYHCEKCNVPVCGRCVTEQHQAHKMVDLITILKKERNKLQNDVIRMKREVLPILKKRKEEITTEKGIYEKNIQKISKEMEDEMKTLNKIHDERMKNLATIRESKLSTFDECIKGNDKEIQKVELAMSEYEEVIRKNSLPTIIKLTKRKNPLPETGRKVNIPNAPVYVSGDLHYVVKYLGKLQVSLPPLPAPKPFVLTTPIVVSKFKCPIQGEPSICITTQGDVWLGGNKSKELVMVDIKGQVLRKRSTMYTTYSLAVMDSGDIIISRHCREFGPIGRLLRDGREQHVDNTYMYGCHGVSITADQKILFCNADGRILSIKIDGTDVKQIYKGSVENSLCHAVDDADGNIYISDYDNHAVVMVSKDGKVLSTITHTSEGQKLGAPQGLAKDKVGNILCADNKNHCVYIIDKNHRVRELVGRSLGIKQPGWPAIDNDNNLWITKDTGKICVVKYLSL